MRTVSYQLLSNYCLLTIHQEDFELCGPILYELFKHLLYFFPVELRFRLLEALIYALTLIGIIEFSYPFLRWSVLQKCLSYFIFH